MSGADHVWEKREQTSQPSRDGEQSPTSDEREIDRLRLEVDRLRRLVTAAAAALDGLLTAMEARGFPVHLLISYHLRRMAHDLRVVLDQGAPR